MCIVRAHEFSLFRKNRLSAKKSLCWKTCILDTAKRIIFGCVFRWSIVYCTRHWRKRRKLDTFWKKMSKMPSKLMKNLTRTKIRKSVSRKASDRLFRKKGSHIYVSQWIFEPKNKHPEGSVKRPCTTSKWCVIDERLTFCWVKHVRNAPQALPLEVNQHLKRKSHAIVDTTKRGGPRALVLASLFLKSMYFERAPKARVKKNWGFSKWNLLEIHKKH